MSPLCSQPFKTLPCLSSAGSIHPITGSLPIYTLYAKSEAILTEIYLQYFIHGYCNLPSIPAPSFPPSVAVI